MYKRDIVLIVKFEDETLNDKLNHVGEGEGIEVSHKNKKELNTDDVDQQRRIHSSAIGRVFILRNVTEGAEYTVTFGREDAPICAAKFVVPTDREYVEVVLS